MIFLPRSTCEKLAKIGCESDSGWGYFKDINGDDYLMHEEDEFYCGAEDTMIVRAFALYDFIAPTETARENARKVWPGRHVLQDGGGYFFDEPNGDFWRRKIVEAEDESAASAIIENALEDITCKTSKK